MKEDSWHFARHRSGQKVWHFVNGYRTFVDKMKCCGSWHGGVVAGCASKPPRHVPSLRGRLYRLQEQDKTCDIAYSLD